MKPDARVKPATVAIIVAIAGAAVLLLGNHGPWSRKPDISHQNRMATEDVVEDAGAKITPTVPESPVSPKPPGPTPEKRSDG